MDEPNRINRGAALGGFAYLAELTTRLFAHRTSELEKFTHSPSHELEVEFFKFLGRGISDDQRDQIAKCREFRNKLLHSRWWAECTEKEYEAEFQRVKETVFLLRKVTGLSEMKMLADTPKEIDLSSLDFAEKFVVSTYRNVAVAATAYEIIVRNFTDGIPELKAIAFDSYKTLEDVQNALSSKLQFHPDTYTLVDNCRKARNKILHCDFYAAKKVAQAIAPKKVQRSGGVLVLDGSKGWDATKVSDATRKGAGAFGWALEGLSSGAADATYEVLSVIGRKFYYKDFAYGPKPGEK